MVILAQKHQSVKLVPDPDGQFPCRELRCVIRDLSKLSRLPDTRLFSFIWTLSSQDQVEGPKTPNPESQLGNQASKAPQRRG